MMSLLRLLAVFLAAATTVLFGAAAAQVDDDLAALAEYRGVFRSSADQAIGVDSFVTDDGSATLLLADYASGLVRRMFATSRDTFVVGPSFAAAAPAEITVRFARDADGRVGGVTLREASGPERTAARLPLAEHEVTFASDGATLAGTLVVPAADGARPAIALLHGSGPLTRNSFGPYRYFFASLGFAVLVYDKRGTGKSTGVRVDASTGRAMAPEIYPTGILDDAVAAFGLLRSRAEVDAARIGFWGSSEGGMLATQAAARLPAAAFAIDSSGFMGPLWQTTLYQAGAYARRAGAAEAEVAEAVAFTRQWLDVARTGNGWDEFATRREALRKKNPSVLFWSSDEFESAAEMRWYWDHVLSFDPLPALARVEAPVLGVFGELDVSTESTVAAENLRRTLHAAGNTNVTVEIFPGANHSLSLASGAGMAPGVFPTLRSWLLARVGRGGERR